MESHPWRRGLLTQDVASATLQSSEHRQLAGWVLQVGWPGEGRTQPSVPWEPQGQHKFPGPQLWGPLWPPVPTPPSRHIRVKPPYQEWPVPDISTSPPKSTASRMHEGCKPADFGPLFIANWVPSAFKVVSLPFLQRASPAPVKVGQRYGYFHFIGKEIDRNQVTHY